eukprot:8742930-Karenia_brevis.AAC.1
MNNDSASSASNQPVGAQAQLLHTLLQVQQFAEANAATSGANGAILAAASMAEQQFAATASAAASTVCAADHEEFQE